MNTNSTRFAVIGISLFLFSLGVSSLAQADTGYPMMGRGEHRGMMGYGYGQGRHMEEEEETYGRMPHGSGGRDMPGCDMAGYGRMGHGKMGYGRMGHGMMSGARVIMQLDLSDDQEKKVWQIYRRLKRENWVLMGDVMEQQDKLYELYDTDTLDTKAIGKVYSAIFDIKRQKIENAIGALNEARALLTDEQKKAFEDEWKKSRRYMGGYGHMH